jgi:hypothetical protein
MIDNNDQLYKLPGFSIKLDKRNWTQWWDQLVKISISNTAVYQLITKGIVPDWTAPQLTIANTSETGPTYIRAPKYSPDGDDEGGKELWKEDCSEVKRRKLKYEMDLNYIFVMIIRNPDELISAELEQLTEYEDKLVEKDIVWLLDKLQFIATGHGGGSVAFDALDYIELKPESYDRAGFIKLAKDAANSRKRFMSRNSDTKMLLEAFLDAIMVMKLKGFPQLKDKLNNIYSKKVWPTAEEIVNDILNYMTALEASNRNDGNHGQMKANIAELEENEYKLMALAIKMQELQRKVNSGREKVNALKASIEKYTSNIPMSKNAKRSFGARLSEKDKTSNKSRTKRIFCLNCGRSGHKYRECKEKKTVCGTCGEYHHTTMHKTVSGIIAKREKKAPFYRSKKNSGEDQAVDIPDIDFSDDSMMDELEESYNSMIQEEHKHAYTRELDEDELDIEDLAVAMHRMI